MKMKIQKSNPSSTNGALLAIMDILNDPQSNGRHYWLPDKLKSMSTWQQQDAQEYFSKVLDQLDREAAQSLRSVDNEIYCLKPDSLDAIPQDHVEGQLSSESLRNPLEGMLAQRVGCTRCGYCEGLSLIPFNCLTVPLGNNYMYDVRDCLDEYTKLEQIEGVECPKCTLQRAEKQLAHILRSDAPEAFLDGVRNRLRAITEALQDEDFSDNTIIKKCLIPKKHWISSTKSKQAVIARPPQSLAIHVNRSLFNELTGAQTKNNANVQFPLSFDLGSWCLGNRSQPNDAEAFTEDWTMDPTQSMLPTEEDELPSACNYELRAVVTHYGRHENGHYVCYRKRPHPGLRRDSPGIDDEVDNSDKIVVSESVRDPEAWWQLSDEDVSIASEDTVLRQGGVFMLFYERIDSPTALHEDQSADAVLAQHITSIFHEPVEASEAAEVPLPSDSDDLDDLLDHFEPLTSKESLFQSDSGTAEAPTAQPSAFEGDIESPVHCEPTAVSQPSFQQRLPKSPRLSDYPTPPPSADEAEADSVDGSDADDAPTTSFHREAASQADTSSATRRESAPADPARMRTSGFASKIGPEDYSLQSLGTRIVTAT
jgi:ubiquitin carboxyl-terminal hydrolase 1